MSPVERVAHPRMKQSVEVKPPHFLLSHFVEA